MTTKNNVIVEIPTPHTLPDGRVIVLANSEAELTTWMLGTRDPDAALERIAAKPDVIRFELHRHVDPTGVSGTGRVAVGWLLRDRAIVRWVSEYPTTTFHDRGLESVLAIHGHVGATEIVYPDHQPVRLPGLDARLVFSPFANAGRPGWLVSLDDITARPDLVETEGWPPLDIDGNPTAWCRSIDMGGEQSHDLRHGDLLCGFVYGTEPDINDRRHLYLEQEVGEAPPSKVMAGLVENLTGLLVNRLCYSLVGELGSVRLDLAITKRRIADKAIQRAAGAAFELSRGQAPVLSPEATVVIGESIVGDDGKDADDLEQLRQQYEAALQRYRASRSGGR